ncbi:FkbM family methyltransferase [Desulfovibrio sp. OttesenSCG-928-G15]|nr:FkbM family methyltransferase [Desulfovibrio sp. OttesenSCG-928-G15]
MTLLTRLNGLPLWRPAATPSYFKNVCLIVSREFLHLAKAFVSTYPNTNVACIALTNPADDTPDEYRFTIDGKAWAIPLGGPEMALVTPQLEKVYCIQPNDPQRSELVVLCNFFAPYGLNMFHTVEFSRNPKHLPVTPRPTFYADNARNLELIHDLLEDEASKNAFAARAKAYLTGDTGYLLPAKFKEYYHPQVKPENGDVLIDGGVSDMVDVQKQFAASVGETGQVHGFEPIADMHASASKTLSEYPWYHLHCLGLGERTEEVQFMMKRDSSHVCEQGTEGSVTCRLTALDDFVADKGLPRVDCIKLDVEGSELAALKGAKKTIRAHKPKLIICLYHKVEDMITLPLYVKELVPEYRLYLDHHSPFFGDSILYARL